MKIKKDGGFTMMEMIIVLAIIAVIGAIILPNLVGATDKARVKSDVESARVITNAIDLYNAENATPLDSDPKVMIQELNDGGYLKNTSQIPQTPKAEWYYNSAADIFQLNITISGVSDSIKKIYDSLSDQDKAYVKSTP